jgi:hypothetical protein
MMNASLTLVALFSFTSVAPSLDADPKDDPREELESAIPEAIRLLEAKEYVTFLKNFVAPVHLKKLAEKGSLEEFAKEFGRTKSGRLLKVLKSIKDAKPELGDEGKKATFKLKEEVEGKKTIVFVKVDKFWYIQN